MTFLTNEQLLARLRELKSLPAPPAELRGRALERALDSGWDSLVTGASRAELVADTGHATPSAGARRAASGPRQLLFRALGYDLVIRVDHAGPGRTALAGQLLPGGDRALEVAAGVEVALERCGRPAAVASTGPTGEFVLDPVENGELTLYVDAEEGWIVARGLTLDGPEG